MKKTIIIVEAGVNHNGDINLAKELIASAAEAGADYVKFQTFIAEKNVSKKAAKASYQITNTGSEESQLEMVKKLEISKEAHLELIRYSNEKGIKFSSTAFDDESLDLLEEFELDFLKVPSGEIVNLPFLRKIGRIGSKGKKVIMSTGMANLGEIEAALEILMNEGVPKSDITILHCNTEYPTPMQDVNLKAMQTIGRAFDVDFGYSDHTLGIEVPIAAVALGASVIEKHFTLDKTMKGPDHAASLEPAELKAMVSGIRNIEAALGNGIKKPTESEAKNLGIVRKSIHLAADVKQGETITPEMLITMRPGGGISPMEWDAVCGKVAVRDLEADEQLHWEDVR